MIQLGRTQFEGDYGTGYYDKGKNLVVISSRSRSVLVVPIKLKKIGTYIGKSLDAKIWGVQVVSELGWHNMSSLIRKAGEFRIWNEDKSERESVNIWERVRDIKSLLPVFDAGIEIGGKVYHLRYVHNEYKPFFFIPQLGGEKRYSVTEVKAITGL
jgi:hypothetical protein